MTVGEVMVEKTHDKKKVTPSRMNTLIKGAVDLAERRHIVNPRTSISTNNVTGQNQNQPESGTLEKPECLQ